MVDYEGADYHQRRHVELLADRELGMAWSHFADKAYFGHVRPGMRVLEFGGGLGYNLMKVRERADVCMVEPSGLGREIAEQNGIRSVKSLEELDGLNFDLILCRHVLEHLETPLEVLREIRNRLAPHGRLVLVVPWEHPSETAVEEEIDFHLYCWSPRTLANLLKVAGFRVESHRFEYFGARRKMLFVYRNFGGEAYARSIRSIGRLFRFREIVFEVTAT